MPAVVIATTTSVSSTAGSERRVRARGKRRSSAAPGTDSAPPSMRTGAQICSKMCPARIDHPRKNQQPERLMNPIIQRPDDQERDRRDGDRAGGRAGPNVVSASPATARCSDVVRSAPPTNAVVVQRRPHRELGDRRRRMRGSDGGRSRAPRRTHGSSWGPASCCEYRHAPHATRVVTVRWRRRCADRAPVRWTSRQRSLPAAGRGDPHHDRPHGGRHRPREAPRHRLPVGRDLRRPALVVGLRPARGRAAPQHPQRLVAGQRATARRRRGRRGRDHHEPARLAGERTPRDVPRPARGMHELPPALPRGSSRGERRRRGALPELRGRGVHRAEAVQPDAEDVPRTDRGRRRRGLPAPGDRAGHVRELLGDPGRLAQEAAVRHRADRQVVPQRDHAGQLHLPHARVRADGDGVLRRARHRRRVVRALGRAAHAVVPRPRRRRRRSCGCGRTSPTSSRTTPRPRPTSSTSSRSAGRSSRASRTAPTTTSRRTRKRAARTSPTSTRNGRPATTRS